LVFKDREYTITQVSRVDHTIHFNGILICTYETKGEDSLLDWNWFGWTGKEDQEGCMESDDMMFLCADDIIPKYKNIHSSILWGLGIVKYYQNAM